jgi:serine/threonine-protein kinase RsbT
VRIASQIDVERIKREARGLATAVGFDRTEAEAIVLAVSELAANLVRYAPGGEVRVEPCAHDTDRGITICSCDSGPGIADVELALRDGYSTGGGLGSGLPAVRRLMDDFKLTTSSAGTHIEARKWLSTPSPLP